MSEIFQQARKPNLASQGHAATVLGSAFVVNLPDEVPIPSALATLIYWAHWHRRVLRDAENVVKAWEGYVEAEPDRGARLRAVMKYLPIEARRVIMEQGVELTYLPLSARDLVVSHVEGESVTLIPRPSDERIAYLETKYAEQLVKIASLENQREAADTRRASFLRQIDERIGYHRDSLNQWRDGTLTPTEPDEDEREKTIEGLKAAISALEVARGLFVGIYGGVG